MSDQKQGAQQAQSAEGKPEASCLSGASSGQLGIRAMQMSDPAAKSDAIATSVSSAQARANAGGAVADVPNAAGGASSGALSTDGCAQGAAAGGAGNADLAALSASTSPASAFMEQARDPGNARASAADASIAVEAAARCGRALADKPVLCKDCTHYVRPTAASASNYYGGPFYSVPMCAHPRAQRDVVIGELATTAKEARYGLGIGDPLCGVEAKLFERRAVLSEPASPKPGSIVYAPPPEPTRSTWDCLKKWFI